MYVICWQKLEAGLVDSGPSFRRSARVNPNPIPNPNPQNGGPPEWQTPGVGGRYRLVFSVWISKTQTNTVKTAFTWELNIFYFTCPSNDILIPRIIHRPENCSDFSSLASTSCSVPPVIHLLPVSILSIIPRCEAADNQKIHKLRPYDVIEIRFESNPKLDC